MDKLILDESKAVLKEEEQVQLPAVDLSAPITIKEEPTVTPEVEENAFKDLINSNIKTEFDAITQLESTVATLSTKGDKYSDIITIINTIIDEKNIQIGMLTKALEVMGSDDTKLMQAGQEKADQIIAEPASKDLGGDK